MEVYWKLIQAYQSQANSYRAFLNCDVSQLAAGQTNFVIISWTNVIAFFQQVTMKKGTQASIEINVQVHCKELGMYNEKKKWLIQLLRLHFQN